MISCTASEAEWDWHEGPGMTPCSWGRCRYVTAVLRRRHVKSGPWAGVPIAGSLGDQMSAMLGQRCKASP